MAEIGDHAARHLMLVGGVVVFGGHPDRETLALGDDREVLGDRPQHLLVDHRPIAEGAQVVGHIEDRGQRRPVGKRRHAGVDDPDAEPHRLQRHQRSEPGGAVAVQLDRNAAAVGQDHRDQRAGALRREQAARILEAEPERRERRRLPAALRVIVVGVDRRDRVDQVDDRIEPELARHLHPVLPPGEVVPGLRDAGLADAVGGHALDEELIHAGRIEAEGVDPSGDQAQRRVGHELGDPADALPRIFAKLPHRLLDVRAREQLDRQETRLIEPPGDRQHHAGRHPLRP